MTHADALDRLLEAVQAELGAARIVGVGHRVVHGGLEFMAPTAVDAAVLQRLDHYVPLAPLHQPHNLAAIRAMLARLPGVPEIACFDTAFHRTVPDVAQRFALPPRFAAAGVRRYGFHGLSYEYIASQLPARRRPRRRRAHGRVPPRQWLEHVRPAGGQQHRDDDGIHGGRRPADGHALRRARSRVSCCS